MPPKARACSICSALWMCSLLTRGTAFSLLRRSTWTSLVALRTATSSIELSTTEIIRKESEEQLDILARHYESQSYSHPIMWTNAEQARSFIDENVDVILFDCDGVLYRTPDVSPGAVDCIRSLQKRGKQIFFVTNNGGINRMELREKLSSILQIEDLREEQMISASFSCAQYLKQKLKTGNLHVIGSQGLCDELRDHGFNLTGGPSTDKSSMSRSELAEHVFPEHPIDAFVVGLDDDFTYRKLCIANELLRRNPDALFVATNDDAFDLVGADARALPGNGAIVNALEYSSGRKATITGKPSTVLADLLESLHGFDLKRTMMVGDRLETDIQFGVDCGMISALVMTGVTST